MRQSIADNPLVTAATTFPVTASVGVAEHLAEESDVSLIERADKALYAAKAAGRNCIKAAVS
jgi:PleD family two-component response regulator